MHVIRCRCSAGVQASLVPPRSYFYYLFDDYLRMSTIKTLAGFVDRSRLLDKPSDTRPTDTEAAIFRASAVENQLLLAGTGEVQTQQP